MNHDPRYLLRLYPRQGMSLVLSHRVHNSTKTLIGRAEPVLKGVGLVRWEVFLVNKLIGYGPLGKRCR